MYIIIFIKTYFKFHFISMDQYNWRNGSIFTSQQFYIGLYEKIDDLGFHYGIYERAIKLYRRSVSPYNHHWDSSLIYS